MRFDKNIDKKYIHSVEQAFDAIAAKGNAAHQHLIKDIRLSDMLVRVKPVSEINASGVTGAIDPVKTNLKLRKGPMSVLEALGEIYIAIARETIDTGGQRGCEGTFVHEGQHALDFAKTISSYSDAAVNPLGIFDPTLYELEWNAHQTAGDYMLCIDRSDYLDEGLSLMILCKNGEGQCSVDDDGIRRRLSQSYGLDIKGDQGATASQMLGLIV